MEEDRKLEIVKRALTEGLLSDPQWMQKLDEPMPAWAVIEMIVKLIDKLDPPYETFD